ncbi:hypothetical protein GCM10019017_63140 [Streptomyces showdoensis]
MFVRVMYVPPSEALALGGHLPGPDPGAARHRRASEPSAYASSRPERVAQLSPRRAAECGVRHSGRAARRMEFRAEGRSANCPGIPRDLKQTSGNTRSAIGQKVIRFSDG